MNHCWILGSICVFFSHSLVALLIQNEFLTEVAMETMWKECVGANIANRFDLQIKEAAAECKNERFNDNLLGDGVINSNGDNKIGKNLLKSSFTRRIRGKNRFNRERSNEDDSFDYSFDLSNDRQHEDTDYHDLERNDFRETRRNRPSDNFDYIEDNVRSNDDRHYRNSLRENDDDHGRKRKPRRDDREERKSDRKQSRQDRRRKHRQGDDDRKGDRRDERQDRRNQRRNDSRESYDRDRERDSRENEGYSRRRDASGNDDDKGRRKSRRNDEHDQRPNNRRNYGQDNNRFGKGRRTQDETEENVSDERTDFGNNRYRNRKENRDSNELFRGNSYEQRTENRRENKGDKSLINSKNNDNNKKLSPKPNSYKDIFNIGSLKGRIPDDIEPLYLSLVDQIPFSFQSLGGYARAKRQLTHSSELSLKELIYEEKKLKYHMSNFTCVLNKMNLIDQNGEVRVSFMIEDLNNLDIDSLLKNDLQKGLRDCAQLTGCYPEDDSDNFIPRRLQQAIFFFRCVQRRRQTACFKKDVRSYLNDVVPKERQGSFNQKSTVDRILYIKMSDTFKDLQSIIT